MMMPRSQIDWSSATVDDGELTVGLVEAPTGAWRKRFTAVLVRLERDGEGWERIAVKKDTIIVSGLAEGSEADLRHRLESVVLETNAQEQPDDTRQSGPDERMTAAFRAFADERD